MSAKAIKTRSNWMRLCAVAALALLVFGSLSGAAAQPRTVLGWELEHFLGYFAVTLIICAAWPRPLVVAAALVLAAGVLEVSQAFTPDRTPNVMAVVYGAAGILIAATLAEVFIRARTKSTLEPEDTR